MYLPLLIHMQTHVPHPEVREVLLPWRGPHGGLFGMRSAQPLACPPDVAPPPTLSSKDTAPEAFTGLPVCRTVLPVSDSSHIPVPSTVPGTP